MSRRSTRRKWLWLAAPLVLGGAVLFGSRLGRAKPAPLDPALLVTVTRRPLDVEILETGRVLPREKVDLKSKIAGQVAAVYVREGERVKKGQVLLVLDPVDGQRQLAKAEADLAQARAARDFARLVRARTERGVAQSIMARNDLDQAEHDSRSKGAALKAAEVARDIARDHLRYASLVSPLDGTVIARGIEPGEAVVPGVQSTFDGKALLTVADLGALLVKVNLNQIDVAKVSVGRHAALTLDALPGHTYEAVVTKVAPASVKLPGKDQEVFPVEAQLERTDGLIKPGMTADVRIRLDKKDGVLVLPLEAIVKESGKSFVMRVTETKGGETHTERVEVKLGLRNDREVEITSGLDEGVRALLRPPSAAENETKL